MPTSTPYLKNKLWFIGELNLGSPINRNSYKQEDIIMFKWCFNFDSGKFEDIDEDGYSWDRGEFVNNWDDSEYRREEEEEEERRRREEEEEEERRRREEEEERRRREEEEEEERNRLFDDEDDW